MGIRTPSEPRVPPPDVKFCHQESNLDNNNASHYNRIRNFRELIIKGIREAIPQYQNLTKVFNIQQGKKEGTSEFLPG
jgi:hypothetical protein